MNMLCAYQYTLDDFYGGKIFFSLYRMCSWRFKIPSAADTVTPRGIPIGAQYKSISSTINLHCDAFSVGIAQVYTLRDAPTSFSCICLEFISKFA